MREILFRGKTEYEKGKFKWVYGYFTNYFGSIIQEKDIKYEVKEETVGEFTGKYDRNEKPIFEGDIVKVTSEYNKYYLHKFEVKFGECGNSGYPEFGYLGFYFDEISNAQKLRTDILYWLNDYNCEVIGNIYDNPELLESGGDSN